MKKFEYREVRIPREDTVERLNELGEEGWEVTTSYPYFNIFLPPNDFTPEGWIILLKREI